MKESYVIAIVRPGMGDIPATATAQTAEAAAAVVRALLECHDASIQTVSVRIDRIINKEVSV